MREHIRSKTKLGYHISTKIISVLLVLLLTTTAFSSVVVAQEPTVSAGDSTVGDVTSQSDDSSKGAAVNQPALKTQLQDIFKELSMLRKAGTAIFSVVTKYNGTETTTRLRLFLPTAIDVNDDGKKDIRVWVFRLPGIDLKPPAACIKTTFLVRRLNDNIKKGPFEIYLQWTPKIISKLIPLPSIRIGYQTPTGEEVPKYCIITHKDIPHILYPRLKTTYRIAINPGPAVGKSQLNLIFSIVNETAQSKLTILINHNPAIKNEISFSLSKDHFIRRGQTLEISRKNVVSSNVSLFIKDVMGNDSGSLTIKNLPKKITLSWLLARKGYVELNTHGSSTGDVEAVVNDAISLGFKPETGINFRLAWEIPGLRNILKKGKSFNIGFDASASAVLSNLYIDIPNSLGLTASLFSLNLKGSVDAGKVVLKPYPGADTFAMNAENADVVLKDCNIKLVPVQPPVPPVKPTVSITYPNDGDVISGIVTIAGTVSAPPGKEIKSVTISIDDGDSILVDGTTEWSYKWDTTSLPNGNHTITAQSFDGESYSDNTTDNASIKVLVNNPGYNWYPSIEITSPSKIADLIVRGIVHITGTARDVDGDKLTVNLTITNLLDVLNIFLKEVKVTVAVDESGNWYYDWDATNQTAGLYTISAKSYDGKDYSGTDSVSVWVKFKCNLVFTLSEGSINVTNFVIQGESFNLGVSTFSLSGTGSVEIADGAITAGISGSLELKDFSALKKNESGVTKLSLENMSFDLSGYGSVELSQTEIGFEINGSVGLGFDALYIADIPSLGTLDLGAFVISGKGLISAGIKKLDENNIEIGGYGDRNDVTIDASDLLLDISGIKQKYFLIGADEILVNGNGNLFLLDNSIEVQGSLDKFVVDNLYFKSDLATLAFSGSIDHLQDASFKVEFTNLLNFNISYDGEISLGIINPKVVLQSAQDTIVAFADSITISTKGYAGFSYYKDNLTATCWVNISEICFTALSIGLDELSIYAGDICGTGSFYFELNSVITITHGEGWINITIGGKGMMHIVAHATIYTDEVYGRLDLDVFFNNGNDIFVINISGIPNDLAVYMDGSAALDLEVFDLLLNYRPDASDLVNISIGKLDGSFVIHANEDIWTIDTTSGINIENMYFSIYMKLLQTFFSVEVDSIETSGGGRWILDGENKEISFKSGDETDKTISLVGLDLIAGFLNVIIEELDIALSGSDTTFSLSSSENITKLNIDFSTDASLAINTLWAYIPGLVEIRVHALEITAPATVTFVKGEPMPLTIETSGTITFDEFSILYGPLGICPSLYGGIIEGSDIFVSVGITSDGGIKFYADAAAQIRFDTIIIPSPNNTTIIPDFNLSFGGKGTIVLKNLDLANPYVLEGNVSETTTVSLKPQGLMRQKLPLMWNIIKDSSLVFTLEPGDFIVNFLIESPPLDIDILLISTSLITIGFKDPISKLINASLSFKGYVELHLFGEIEEQNDTFNTPIFSGQIAGWFKISRYKLIGNYIKERYIILSGNGSGYISTSKTNNDTINLVVTWDSGTITFIRNIEIMGVETAFRFGLHDVDIDLSLKMGKIGYNTLILLGAVLRTIIGNRIGIWYLDSDGEWQLLNPLLKLLYWWLDIEPPLPKLKGVTTLLSESFTGSIEKIPGDNVSFTAWYVPASMMEWESNAPQNNPNDQGQPGSQQQNGNQQNNQGQGAVLGQENNKGQGAAPLGYGQDLGGTYTFTLNYGDGNSQDFLVNYSDVPVPIKVDLDSHLYISPGTYTAMLTVSGDPDAEEDAVDTLTIKVVEKYLGISTSRLTFDYANVGDDGKIRGSFEVYNLASEDYSGGYVLDWSILEDNIKWGENWKFEPSSGSLLPNSSQKVEFSFTPPNATGDYGNDSSITIVNDNDLTENKTINLELNYGLIELLPIYPIVLYMDTGGTRTLENVFWVHRTRWEKNDAGVAWEVCESSFAPGMVTFIPDSGVIPKGKGPTPVDLIVTASDGVYKGTVKVCRVDDPSDNDTVDITLVVGMNGQLNIDLIHNDDRIFENDPFLVNLTDEKTGEPIPDATVTYYENHDGKGNMITNTTDANGLAGFTAFDLPDGSYGILSKVEIDTVGYNAAELLFTVSNSKANIHGFVKDKITGNGIVGANVVAQPGNYSFITVNQNGQYLLMIPAGTYTFNASKEGYLSNVSGNIVVEKCAYIWIDFCLMPENLPPVADAGPTAGPWYYSGYADEPISFDGSGSYDPDGFIVQYDWRWYAAEDWENNIGPNPTHVYTTPGYRTISLRVHDNGSSTDEDNAVVIVSKGLKIDAPNSVNENEWFTVTVTKRDGSPILGCFVDFNGETKYAPFGIASFQAPAVYMNVDKLIHAWQELSDNVAYRYITVINTG
jgi:hypothetical protein